MSTVFFCNNNYDNDDNSNNDGDDDSTTIYRRHNAHKSAWMDLLWRFFCSINIPIQVTGCEHRATLTWPAAVYVLCSVLCLLCRDSIVATSSQTSISTVFPTNLTAHCVLADVESHLDSTLNIVSHWIARLRLWRLWCKLRKLSFVSKFRNYANSVFSCSPGDRGPIFEKSYDEITIINSLLRSYDRLMIINSS